MVKVAFLLSLSELSWQTTLVVFNRPHVSSLHVITCCNIKIAKMIGTSYHFSKLYFAENNIYLAVLITANKDSNIPPHPYGLKHLLPKPLLTQLRHRQKGKSWLRVHPKSLIFPNPHPLPISHLKGYSNDKTTRSQPLLKVFQTLILYPSLTL